MAYSLFEVKKKLLHILQELEGVFEVVQDDVQDGLGLLGDDDGLDGVDGLIS